jgi:hypothetical protein
MKILMLATVFLFGCLPAQAQTQEEANQLGQFLAKKTSQLAKDNMTMFWMTQEKPSPESIYLRSVNDGVSRAIDEFSHLATLAEIYSLMVSPEDRLITKRYLSSAVAGMFPDNIQIGLLKKEITKINSPSVQNHALNAIKLIEEMHREVNDAIPTKSK